MKDKIAAFFSSHNFVVQDVDTVAQAILFDMEEGLCGRPSGQDMIKTYISPPDKTAAGKDVIVIDAGGTNFRSCLVSFDSAGVPSISYMEKTRMPGVERELSKTEFFAQIASNLEHLRDKAERIGFCFSYPVEIQEDGDGVLLKFSKEVKAPQVEGCKIGSELIGVLKERGWRDDLRVVLLNDTVAALLAGAANVADGKRYSSYVGFILGTGMNAAYIQKPLPQYKANGLKKAQVINCEAGRFAKVARSDFDLELNRKSESPGTGVLEKLCSGAYLGAAAFEAVKTAASEGVFSSAVCASLLKLESLTQIEMDAFLHAPYLATSKLGEAMEAGGATEEDRELLFEILDAFADRCARLAASIITACVVKSEAGASPVYPVKVLCNGTSFYKTYRVRQRAFSYLEEFLTHRRGLHFELAQLENDITLGTAIGGLI